MTDEQQRNQQNSEMPEAERRQAANGGPDGQEPEATETPTGTESETVSEFDAAAGADETAETPEAVEEVNELATLRAERDDFLDQLQRSRAEFANFRRRNEQERAMLRELVSRDVLAQFLPVIDDFDRALAAIPESERESGWTSGITLIHTKLSGILERAGVTPIDALNQPFDPSIHEAVATEPGTSGSTVVEVYQTGYRLKDLLLRPAMVKTGDAPADTASVTGGNGQTTPEMQA